MRFIQKWFILIIIFRNYFFVAGEIFFISDYGAYPDDNHNNTNGIQLAIHQAINHDLNNEIIFGVGIYNISSTIFIYNANNLTLAGQIKHS